MYKVFVNNKPIVLTDATDFSGGLKIVNYQEVKVPILLSELKNDTLTGIILYDKNLKKMWKSFKKNFNIQKAAGGKVFNTQNEVLFIYRLGKWDLPKGKLEKGESVREGAVREVEEESGVQNLHIVDQLQTTYHIFERNEKSILKITHWFLMVTNYCEKLTPQLEEGIEQVAFKNKAETKLALENTYENIKLLF